MIFTKGAHHTPHLQDLMIQKSDEKIEKITICRLKNDTNLVNFDPSTQKTQKLALRLVSFVQSV